jgi:XTP/dITP diphosphohydrolase
VKLVFASRNLGKIAEVSSIFQPLNIEVVSLDQVAVPADFDVEEIGDTFAEIAELKAAEYAKKTKILTLADDSGLCVNALGGEPGVHSKRFFPGTDHDRNQHLLALLEGKKDRSAFFVTVVCLFDPATKKTWSFEGRVDGMIADEESGSAGFGYDPVFIPEGYSQTFAQLGPEVKNIASHRARALAKCATFMAEHIKEF